ncbi:MAG: AAA family ATPase, partial [Lachnospiraceae bacterium]|nr:AAA family ATPase [Lachnospiraceae bacterium]
MAKAKNNLVFFCKECGYESGKWMGQCPACKAWNSFVEEPVVSDKKSQAADKIRIPGRGAAPVRISEISIEDQDRTTTGFGELDRVLGSGIVKGSLVLVGGDPGIGKSTLLLQVCRNLAHSAKKVLYISGEESLKQIKMRANRIGQIDGELYFVSETNLDMISGSIEDVKPDVVIIDSIQTMYREDITSAPGSVSQVREST